MGTIKLSAVPPVRVNALARYAAAARTSHRQDVTAPPPGDPPRLRQGPGDTALDDVLDLFDQLVTTMLARVEHAGQQRRLRSLKDLEPPRYCFTRRVSSFSTQDVPTDASAKPFSLVSLRTNYPGRGPGRRPRRAGRRSLLRGPADPLQPGTSFLPTLLEAVEFAATDAGRPATEAFRFLKTIEGQKRPDMSQAPQALLTPAWKRVVIGPEGRIDRHLYTFCVLERLQDGLKRRDLFVPDSRRWGDPYAKLLQGRAWEKARSRLPDFGTVAHVGLGTGGEASASSSTKPTAGPRKTCRPTPP